MHKVSVVIPFYNGDKYIGACLKSLSCGSCASAEKFVVNNSDKSTRIHEIAAHYENVSVIDTRHRIGFGRACNQGAEIAIKGGAEFIIFLNQDSIAHDDLVLELISAFETSPELAISAPILYNYNFSSIDKHFISHYLSMCPNLFLDALNRDVKDRYNLDAVTGACLAIRSDFITRYGLFDPLYFMYFEDDDLCRRVKLLNYDIAIVPKAKIGHDYQAEIALRRKSSQIYKNSREVHQWFRHSKSIFALKDINKPLLKIYLKLSITNVCDYITYISALDAVNLAYAFISDINLIIGLPNILRSRNAERHLISKSTRTSRIKLSSS
jgi:GT2 family glycosyltransferase